MGSANRPHSETTRLFLTGSPHVAEYIGKGRRPGFFLGQIEPGMQIHDLAAHDLCGVRRVARLKRIEKRTVSVAFDALHFPPDQSTFIDIWTQPPRSVQRKTFVAMVKGARTGFGTIRACRNGCKIGPLFCELGRSTGYSA